jgi:hypothetical protein
MRSREYYSYPPHPSPLPRRLCRNMKNLAFRKRREVVGWLSSRVWLRHSLQMGEGCLPAGRQGEKESTSSFLSPSNKLIISLRDYGNTSLKRRSPIDRLFLRTQWSCCGRCDPGAQSRRATFSCQFDPRL